MNHSNNANIDPSCETKHLIDYLLDHEDVRSELYEHFYSNFSIKFDQLRHFLVKQTSSVRLVEFYQLQIYETLENKDFSFSRIHLLQLIFQFYCFLQQNRKSITDEHFSLLIYANFVANIRRISNQNFIELKKSIDYFLDESIKEKLWSQAEKCHCIYSLHHMLKNIDQLHWLLLDDDNFEEIRYRLNKSCVKVGFFPSRHSSIE